jgi:hypothetical protein
MSILKSAQNSLDELRERENQSHRDPRATDLQDRLAREIEILEKFIEKHS